MEGYLEIERFSDKKVKISIVENIATKTKNILKLYPNRTTLELELEWLQKFYGNPTCKVPKIIKATDRELLLEYVSGKTLLQELIDGAMFKVNMLASALARFFKSFYEQSGGNIIDEVNLNGYIFRGGFMVGFDFVTTKTGELSSQASEIISSILVDTRISDIRKQMFIREFLRVFGGTVLERKNEILERLNQKLVAQNVKDVTAEELYKIVGKV